MASAAGSRAAFPIDRDSRPDHPADRSCGRPGPGDTSVVTPAKPTASAPRPASRPEPVNSSRAAWWVLLVATVLLPIEGYIVYQDDAAGCDDIRGACPIATDGERSSGASCGRGGHSAPALAAVIKGPVRAPGGRDAVGLLSIPLPIEVEVIEDGQLIRNQPLESRCAQPRRPRPGTRERIVALPDEGALDIAPG